MAEPKVKMISIRSSVYLHRFRKMKHTNLIKAAFLTLSFALGACASEEQLLDVSKDVIRNYELSLRESQDELNFSLTDINQPVVDVKSPFDWLSIVQDGTDGSGNTRIRIARTKPTPTDFKYDNAFIYLSDKKIVQVTIIAEDQIMPSDENSADYSAFNKEWWNQQTILYASTSKIDTVDHTEGKYIDLPWADAAVSNIPNSLLIKSKLSSDAGWTMAYNLFAAKSNDKPMSKPYFMLYNKYTGALRVFYYQMSNPGTGGELSFAITPDQAYTSKFPFFHSLQYGIPVGNTDVINRGNVLNIVDGNSAFQQLITPYLKDNVVLTQGWYCFDIDLSAYNPATKTPFGKDDRMGITGLTSINATTTMAGMFDGKAHGTIENLKETSTSSGKGTNIIDLLKPGYEKIKSTVDAIKKGETLKAIFNGALSLYNVGKFCKSVFGVQQEQDEVKYEPPTIEQSFNGNISMESYTKGNTSNNATGVDFTYNAFALDDNVGKGVWSLQENPVVYVVKDLLLGEDEDLSVVVAQEGYLIGSDDPEPNNLRLFTYLDPQSIKLNLNTENFRDISNVKIAWIYGVYPNQEQGHTDVFRNDFLGFKANGVLEEPVFITKKDNIGKSYKSFSSTFANMSYMEFPMCDMTATSIDSSSEATFFRQKNGKYRYYGHSGNDLSADDKDFFIVDPTVFLPCELIKNDPKDKLGKAIIYDFEAPDFVVGVMITFDFKAPDNTMSSACFSKRFLPEVRGISYQDLVDKLESIKQYANTTTHQTINGVKVSHGDITSLMDHTVKTIEYIKKHK